MAERRPDMVRLTRRRLLGAGGLLSGAALTGIGLFIGFGLFFEGVVNLSEVGGFAEPVLAGGLVVLGVIVVLYGLFRRPPVERPPTA